MSHVREKIQKTIRAIAKAESKGKDSSLWQAYLIELIDKFQEARVRVKVGRFGFCTCTEDGGLCVGCWRIKQSCECIELIVDPDIEVTRQYRTRMNGAN